MFAYSYRGPISGKIGERVTIRSGTRGRSHHAAIEHCIGIPPPGSLVKDDQDFWYKTSDCNDPTCCYLFQCFKKADSKAPSSDAGAAESVNADSGVDACTDAGDKTNDSDVDDSGADIAAVSAAAAAAAAAANNNGDEVDANDGDEGSSNGGTLFASFIYYVIVTAPSFP